MDRIAVVKSMQELQHNLAYNEEFADLSEYATELAFLIREYKRLLDIEEKFVDEVTAHTVTKQGYINVVRKMDRSKGFLKLIRKEISKEIPNLRDIKLLSNEVKPKERKK